jgi:hypothetical protein
MGLKDLSAQGADLPGPEARMSGRLLIARAGAELGHLCQDIQALESHLLHMRTVVGTPPLKPKVQSLDLIVQKLAGLSQILLEAATHLSDAPDARLEDLPDLPRLESLATALRGILAKEEVSPIELF